MKNSDTIRDQTREILHVHSEILCMNWGFQSIFKEDYSLLGYYAVLLGNLSVIL
jgi:hypothetical protein